MLTNKSGTQTTRAPSKYYILYSYAPFSTQTNRTTHNSLSAIAVNFDKP